jgi:hypothetical protein
MPTPIAIAEWLSRNPILMWMIGMAMGLAVGLLLRAPGHEPAVRSALRDCRAALLRWKRESQAPVEPYVTIAIDHADEALANPPHRLVL